jgi:hypothetical protein
LQRIKGSDSLIQSNVECLSSIFPRYFSGTFYVDILDTSL